MALFGTEESIYSQDIAAEQSTMAYRAPELFDVKTGITLDEKVDIWVSRGSCHFCRRSHISSISLWAALFLPSHTLTLPSRTHKPIKCELLEKIAKEVLV